VAAVHNDDPDFSGYDSDREERTEVTCDAHKAILNDLETKRTDLFRNLTEIDRQISDASQPWNVK
jgi:hypothetical protein